MTVQITPEMEIKCMAWAMQRNKNITDPSAFEDAQLMARIAFAKCNVSFWAAAMLALKQAYKAV